jgi:hypothetical protein
MKSCGGCTHFIKFRSEGDGLCDIKDAIVKSDYGKKCRCHKGKKYDRNIQKKIAFKLISEAMNQTYIVGMS